MLPLVQGDSDGGCPKEKVMSKKCKGENQKDKPIKNKKDKKKNPKKENHKDTKKGTKYTLLQNPMSQLSPHLCQQVPVGLVPGQSGLLAARITSRE